MTSALWNNLLEAFGETMLAAAAFVTLFSLGVRVLGKSRGSAAQAPGNAAESGNVSEAGAVLCFVLCVTIVAFGIYLAATK